MHIPTGDVLPVGYIFATAIRTIIPAWFEKHRPSSSSSKTTRAVRQPLVKFLQMRQYTVVTAETADEGLDAIKTHRPAAAIVDLRLRRGSGREVVVSAPPEIPVIIFSGLRSESADLETIRPNTRLVEKPYSLVMLMDTLEDMLEQSRGNSSGFGRIAASQATCQRHRAH